MHQSVGEYIRQLRRQQSLTQTELGGDHFSKSYVSAVERDKIMPSYEALHFFAEQLGQTRDFFEKFNQPTQVVSVATKVYRQEDDDYTQRVQQKISTLLEFVAEGTESYNLPLLQEVSSLAPEVVESLPLQKQGQYFFLNGKIAQSKGDLLSALYALEHALALAPTNMQTIILDALGVNYYLMQAYQVAVNYHKRALALQEELVFISGGTSSALQLNITFHCAEAYRALGAYRQARDYYEQARSHLRSTHDMRTAGQLYLGLGYCTYACIYQDSMSPDWQRAKVEQDKVEREFQRAISFLVQSRTLFQVSSNRMGEAQARLSQAMVLLDLSTQRTHIAQQQAKNATTPLIVNCAVLLDEAKEQCRQVLLEWQDDIAIATSPPEVEVLCYIALAYLTRVHTQYALLARLAVYTDTAARERSLATHLCQRMLDSLAQPFLFTSAIQEALATPIADVSYRSQSLLRLPKLSKKVEGGEHSSPNIAEVYIAAAGVAEELARSAAADNYAHDCYACADTCLNIALSMADTMVVHKQQDPSYLIRCYQRVVRFLQERLVAAPAFTEQTIQLLFSILKSGLSQLQYPALFVENVSDGR